MSIRIDIVNAALSLLGANTVTSIEDGETDAGTKEATVMRAFYYMARDSTLEESEWGFAKKHFIPAESPDAREWSWAYAFPIPSDILRVTRVDSRISAHSGGSQCRVNADHEVAGRIILTNEPDIYCTGIRRVEDEGIYSGLFAEAFAAKLAFLSCLTLTESNTKQQTMLAIHAGLLRTAKARDGMQNTTRSMSGSRNNSLRNARY